MRWIKYDETSMSTDHFVQISQCGAITQLLYLRTLESGYSSFEDKTNIR